ncbi:Cof-type HAD-IIB family hydrolase [Aquibacillus koreensis]|uniref:Cof-type HAD-IIB family hydrolase n=1 Tax=Aquibacillus koreensis TaxID=279446 RepID=A0A9X3WQI2_9BACI|nr:Cof-type HAD-IIB family hydrolase [Aquibacillus koreensis]MCT2534464.1 Cof-type HAD-IIB family hydrolase [Aquibacillus koreensis]MDC3421771.1 Cof-type HAD-IIB family hydrolase [Aquibacillus koreensis]
MRKDKKIRLIALDLDGTLLSEQDMISQENIEAIKLAREHGVEVIFSTGRHYSTCKAFAEQLQLSSYLITVNGSEIRTVSGELVDRQLLDIAVVEHLVALHKKYKTYAWMTSTEQIWRGELPSELEVHQWLKFGYDTDDPSVKMAIMEELASLGELEISDSSPTNIEVNAVGINKAVAIEKVCKRLGLSMDEVMAAGDSLNDIKMIEACGLGVAMGNAQDQVKASADWVTKSNVEHGVAHAIHTWVLQ